MAVELRFVVLARLPLSEGRAAGGDVITGTLPASAGAVDERVMVVR